VISNIKCFSNSDTENIIDPDVEDEEDEDEHAYEPDDGHEETYEEET
jgi:hypothetical protein